MKSFLFFIVLLTFTLAEPPQFPSTDLWKKAEQSFRSLEALNPSILDITDQHTLEIIEAYQDVTQKQTQYIIAREKEFSFMIEKVSESNKKVEEVMATVNKLLRERKEEKENKKEL